MFGFVEESFVVNDIVHAGGPSQRRSRFLFTHRHAHVFGFEFVHDARPVLELLTGIRMIVQAIGDFGDDLWFGFEF